jgi:hypothetical protein
MLETTSVSVSPKKIVWGLYSNYPGGISRLTGLFSSAELAKSCELIEPSLLGPWQYRDYGDGHGIWQVNALHPDQVCEPFRYTVEPIEVDRLVES